MEHIVQFAIGIDDVRICEKIESSAEKQITDDIRQMVMDKMLDKGYYAQHATSNDPLKDWVRQEIVSFMAEHKEEILNKAASELADHLRRSKKARDYILNRIVGEEAGADK